MKQSTRLLMLMATEVLELFIWLQQHILKEMDIYTE